MSRSVVCIAFAASLYASSTLAAAEVLEEIVVRADFRAAALMQSVGSISVIDERRIQDRAARHFDETINMLPNVNFTAGGARARFVQVRGVGDLEQFVDPKHFPSVGITIDDVEVGTTASGAILMDVQQIEVLRGPQGTEFGANALAGIVNIRTREPSASLSGYLDAGYGNFNTWHVGGGVSGPLSESLSARLAVQQNRSAGYYKNIFLNSNDNNKKDELALRGKLQWLGNTGAAIKLSASYSDLNGGYDAFSLDNVPATLSDKPGHDRQESIALALKSDWPLRPGLRLETLFSWRNNEEDYAFDEDWVFAGFCDGKRCDPALEFSATDQLARNRDVLALDVRLKSAPTTLGWVAGLYAQRRDEDLQRQRFGRFASAYETARYAIYGQFQAAPADKWQLTAGLRYEHFADSYQDSEALSTASHDNYWSAQLSLAYRHNDTTLFYARLARGVKPGGVNTETSVDFPNISPSFRNFLRARQRFVAETLLNREIGMKAGYLDDRLKLRLALFHMTREHAQLESFVWDANTFIFTGFLDSSSAAKNYGAELETTWQVARHVELFANVGYLRSSVNELTVFDLAKARFVTRSDRAQAKAPQWQYNVGTNLRLGDRLSGHLEVEGRDKSFFGYYHNGQLAAYTLVHASVRYQFGGLAVQAWARNILDKNYAIHGLYFANDPRDGFATNRSYYQFGEPRAYGLNISYAF